MKALVVQNVTIEGPGLLQPAMEKAGWRLDIRIMDQAGASLPGNLSGYKALIVLGGPMNVYEVETYPYLKVVEKLILDASQSGLPVLGICLGGQLIAKTFGAPVTKNPVKEIGWHKLRLTPEGLDSPLFARLPEEFPVFQWHEDTFALPFGASHLAFTGDCLNQAFSRGGCIFALQFHLEVTPEIIKTWAREYSEDLEQLAPGTAGRMVTDTQMCWDNYKQVADQFLKNWLELTVPHCRGKKVCT